MEHGTLGFYMCVYLYVYIQIYTSVFGGQMPTLVVFSKPHYRLFSKTSSRTDLESHQFGKTC